MDEKKIQEINFFEQNLQSILIQKQAFQLELGETLNALSEIEKSKEDIYKLIGQLMIKTSREKIIKELKDKEKLFQTRLDGLEKQEKKLLLEIKKLREEIFNSNKNKK